MIYNILYTIYNKQYTKAVKQPTDNHFPNVSAKLSCLLSNTFSEILQDQEYKPENRGMEALILFAVSYLILTVLSVTTSDSFYSRSKCKPPTAVSTMDMSHYSDCPPFVRSVVAHL